MGGGWGCVCGVSIMFLVVVVAAGGSVVRVCNLF